MTDSPPKRATWPIKLALVAVGVMGLAAGSLLAMDQVTRHERQAVAARELARQLKVLGARLDGGLPAVERVVERLHAGVIDGPALEALVGGELPSGLRNGPSEFLDVAVVRPAAEHGVETVAWEHDPHGKLAALFGTSALIARQPGSDVYVVAPESRGHREIFEKLGELKGVARKCVFHPFDPQLVIDADGLHREVVGAVYLAAPSPVLLVVLVRQSEPVPSVLQYLLGKVENHDRE